MEQVSYGVTNFHNVPNTSFKRRSPLKGPTKNTNKPKNNIDSGLAGRDFAALAQSWTGSIRQVRSYL